MRSAQQATTTTTGLLPGNDCSAAFFFFYLHFWPREMRRASSLGLLQHPSDDCLLYQNGRPGNNNNNNKKKLFRVDVLQLAADYVAVSADSAGNISDLNVISFQFHRPRIGLFLATAHSSDGRPAFVSPNFNPLVGRLNFTGSPLKKAESEVSIETKNAGDFPEAQGRIRLRSGRGFRAEGVYQ